MNHTPSISAYIPVFNNRITALKTVESILNQSVPVGELFVIDDGSTDGGGEYLQRKGIRVIRFDQNQGRGAVRAHAMKIAKGDWVLNCDATNVLASDFVEKALPELHTASVHGIVGRIVDPNPSCLSDRWRNRHLFQVDWPQKKHPIKHLSTGACFLRKQSVINAGNFNPTLRHSEDWELGTRMLARGMTLIKNPDLIVMPTTSNTIPQLLERYWRWYAGADENVTFGSYVKQVIFSLKVMVSADIKARDPMSIPITLALPHYQFWKSLSRNPSKAIRNAIRKDITSLTRKLLLMPRHRRPIGNALFSILETPSNASGLSHSVLSPERQSVRNVPLYADPPMQSLLSAIPNGKIKRRFVCEIEKGTSWGIAYGAAISKADELIVDLSPSLEYYGREHAFHRHEALERPWRPSTQHLRGRALAIHTYGQSNFHHWLLDTLPSFGNVIDSGMDFNQFDHILLQTELKRFHKESLAALGIPLNRILRNTSKTQFSCESLVVPSFSEPGRDPEQFDYTPEGINFVRSLFPHDLDKSPNRKIIISRELTTTRRILDGDQFHQDLQEHGFEKLCLEEYSIQQQAKFFSDSSVVVMPTGGGLANLIFCQKGSLVVEIFSPAYLPTFCHTLCTSLGLRYIALVGEPTNQINFHSDTGNQQDISISSEKVIRTVEAFA